MRGGSEVRSPLTTPACDRRLTHPSMQPRRSTETPREFLKRIGIAYGHRRIADAFTAHGYDITAVLPDNKSCFQTVGELALPWKSNWHSKPRSF